MSILAGAELSALMEGGAVEGMRDKSLQTQMCAVELTLSKVERFSSRGSVDFDNSERALSVCQHVPFDENGWVCLQCGAYLVTWNEIVSVPPDMAAIARPRSSLLRNGATICTALWDPGYKGRSQSMLVVYNIAGLRLKRDARLLQLLFVRLSSKADRLYSGIYQGENI
jgi:dUTP pyrophosphatase